MTKITAKPFLKWAGGKTQIIDEIAKLLPQKLHKTSFTYIEPFVGSGAVLFWMLKNFPNIKTAIINDINEDLINVYKVIAKNPQKLISILEKYQKRYYELENNGDAKKEYYYKQRDLFNQRKEDKITHAALFIFLNKTCFNGLYRVNSKNEFNVPIGKYKYPKICDKENIFAVSANLKKVKILCGDFENTLDYVDKNTFVYLDPPYKPISKTSSFQSYTMFDFTDKDQIRLKNFCKKLDDLGCTWILSNSDLTNTNSNDLFFDNLYSEFLIKRVNAKRFINAIGNKRGTLKELLITNQKNIKEYAEGL
ncbi:MAG: DNA adenine methylase [Bacteroidia bacterium]|jgi:DNA adenine methylase|nr:DNA adenine methylase [Bacteroidia bacterium]